MSLNVCFPDELRLQVMGIYGCTHKSVSVGIPLLNAIYENDPNLGIYTLPLLIWHPAQIMIGSTLAPYLAKKVKQLEG
jgi:solute carrier family 10 (sodium/bile acid cotransporter), member 7